MRPRPWLVAASSSGRHEGEGSPLPSTLRDGAGKGQAQRCCMPDLPGVPSYFLRILHISSAYCIPARFSHPGRQVSAFAGLCSLALPQSL